MTDSSIDQSVTQTENHQVPAVSTESSEDIHLQYPQLLLEASLQSLLSRSYSTDTASAVVSMPAIRASLSESWASFSDADFSQEDDLRSEITDAGSLIDVNSTQDIHSIDEQGDLSDVENHDEAHMKPHLPASSKDGQVEEEYDVVRHRSFSPSALVASTDTVVVGTESDSSVISEKLTPEDSVESLFKPDTHRSNVMPLLNRSRGVSKPVLMAPPKSFLALGQRPFRVLYLGSKSVPSAAKVEVLRKIGAVLVAGAADTVDSTCYHVVPSEFGPGARPETTELIPVPTQMIIHECKVPDHGVKKGEDLELTLLDGAAVRCLPLPELEIQGADGHWHKPDLLLVLFSSAGEKSESCYQRALLDLGRACFLPSLALEHSTDHLSLPPMHDLRPNIAAHEEHDEHDEILCPNTSPLIDLDTFVESTAEQLNGYLNHLTTTQAEARHKFAQSARNETNTGVSRWLAGLTNAADGEAAEVDGQLGDASGRSEKSRRYGGKHGRTYKTTARILQALLMTLVSSVIVTSCIMLINTWLSQISGSQQLRISDAIPDSRCPGPHVSMSQVGSASETASATFANYSLLSEKLREVAEYLPVMKATEKVQLAKSQPQQTTDVDTRASHYSCAGAQHVIHLRRGEPLEIPDRYFESEQVMIDVHVHRGKRGVQSLLRRAHGNAYKILVDPREQRGLLTVQIKGTDDSHPVACAVVDLEKASVEHDSRVLKSQQSETYARHSDRWELIRICSSKGESQTRIHDIARSALEVLDSAQSRFLEVLYGQTATYRNYAETCLTSQAREYQHRLSTMVQRCERLLVSSGQQAHEHARNLAGSVAVRANNAVQLVQESVLDIHQFPTRLSRKAAKRAARAQKRARKLVERQSRSACGRRC